MAASALITWRVSAVSVPTVTPSSVVACPEMTLGETRTPPLATVLIAAAICTALTDSDCPNAIRSLVCDVSSGPAGMMPAVSPRTPMSVVRPRPNERR